MKDRINVFFPLDPPSDIGVTGEWLWTEPMGGGKFRVDNLPYDVYDISLGDVVTAEDIGGVLTFQSIDVRSGHSTYRIRLPKKHTHQDFLKIWPPFEAQKCTYEGASGEHRLYSIDVLQDADIFAVYALLEKGEKAGKFEFEEAHYCKPQNRH